jgi:pimeloyl-ACP methyl ester carboxylesterase
MQEETPMRTLFAPMLRCSLISLIGLVASGCIAHQQYRTEYSRCTVTSASGSAQCEKNALQDHSNGDGSSYLLSFVEFDDQGQLWDRRQADAVLDAVAAESGGRDLLIVVFAHGWKHSAAPGDRNIETFRRALANLSAADARAQRAIAEQPRQVVGVYLGWRGGSVRVPLIKELTFWERKNTAQKVGHGSVTEVLSRLEVIKRTKNALEGNRDTRLVVVGHSFGGAAVYAAVGQLLANRFVLTEGPVLQQTTVAGYGDLVVLINPAFEATLFASLSDMSTERGNYFDTQLPVLAVLTSEADNATKVAFPIGRRLSTLFEKTHPTQRRNAATEGVETIDGDDANVTAVGHFKPYRTHTLTPSDDRKRAEVIYADAEQVAQSSAQASTRWADDEPGSTISFGAVTLKRTATSAGRNPYILTSVDKELIQNHNDIDDPRVIQFVEQLILISTQSTEQLRRTLENKTRGLGE